MLAMVIHVWALPSGLPTQGRTASLLSIWHRHGTQFPLRALSPQPLCALLATPRPISLGGLIMSFVPS